MLSTTGERVTKDQLIFSAAFAKRGIDRTQSAFGGSRLESNNAGAGIHAPRIHRVDYDTSAHSAVTHMSQNTGNIRKSGP